MPRLLLVRHAQSANNFSDEAIYRKHFDDPERAYAESTRARVRDPELSAIGRTQAEQLAEAVVPLLLHAGERALLVSSPMRRALQTALPLAIGAQLTREQFVCHAELFEIGSRYYRVDALPSIRTAQLEAEYPLRCQAIPSDEDYAGGRRESAPQIRERVDRVIAWTESTLARGEHELVVVVAHGHLLTRWLRRWIGVPSGRGLAFVHANAAVTLLNWNRRDGLLLEYLNDEGHLDVEVRTSDDNEGWWDYTLPDLEVQHFRGWSAVPAELAAQLADLRRQVLEPDGKTLADHAHSDERNIHIVAWVADAVAGYVQYDVELGRLRQLIVGPEHRRSRLGRGLVLEVELQAMLAGLEELLVHAWVDSVGFYRSVGFVARGSVESGPGVPWQAMVKPLSSPFE